MASKKIKKKAAHRPKGSANEKTKYVRTERIGFMASEGYAAAVTALARVLKKSKATVQHEAVKAKAIEHWPELTEKEQYWVNKI